MASLSEDDRAFLEGHKGLGNSQKAEVAWLERRGYEYEELDVRDFSLPKLEKNEQALVPTRLMQHALSVTSPRS
jgi:hypothetical protein